MTGSLETQPSALWSHTRQEHVTNTRLLVDGIPYPFTAAGRAAKTLSETPQGSELRISGSLVSTVTGTGRKQIQRYLLEVDDVEVLFTPNRGGLV